MPVDMKLLIAETFGKLAQRGNIDKITVKALIEECHISRQTFYYHFQDIMDVLEWSVRRQTQALLEQSLAERTFTPPCRSSSPSPSSSFPCCRN